MINAYMYDAMINHGIVELGPAMHAGQSGLNKNFHLKVGLEKHKVLCSCIF